MNATACISLTSNVTSGSNQSDNACTDDVTRVEPANQSRAASQQVLAILCFTVAACSLYTNGFLIAGLRSKSTRSGRLVHDVILINMSICDLLQTAGGATVLAIALMKAVEDWGYTLYGLFTVVCVTVNNLTMTSFLVERSLHIRQRFADNHARTRTRNVSISLSTTSSSSRDLNERRLAVLMVFVCWLPGAAVGALYTTVGWYSSIRVIYTATSFIFGFILPVTVGTVAGRDVIRLSVLVGRAVTVRSSRRHSSMVWLASRVNRRSSRLSNQSGERKSVSSVCDVLIRDADILTRRSLADEVSGALVYSRKTVRFCCISVLVGVPFSLTSIIVAFLGVSTSYGDLITMTSLICFMGSVYRPVYILSINNHLRDSAITVCCGKKLGRTMVGPEVAERLMKSNFSENDRKSRKSAAAAARIVRINSTPEFSSHHRSAVDSNNMFACTQSPTLHLTPIEEQSSLRSVSKSPPHATRHHSDGDGEAVSNSPGVFHSEHCRWLAKPVTSHCGPVS